MRLRAFVAKIRQNGRLQVLPSAIRQILLSLILHTPPPRPHVLLFSPSFFKCFKLSYTCFTNSSAPTSSLFSFLHPSVLVALSLSLSFPLLQPVKKCVLQQSSPAAADCLYMGTSYLMRQVGGGELQLISLPGSLSWLILSSLFIVCVSVRVFCLCACAFACMCMYVCLRP